jgi:hypothetical protein
MPNCRDIPSSQARVFNSASIEKEKARGGAVLALQKRDVAVQSFGRRSRSSAFAIPVVKICAFLMAWSFASRAIPL